MSISVKGLSSTKNMLRSKGASMNKGKDRANNHIKNLLSSVPDRIYKQRTYDGRRLRLSQAAKGRSTSVNRAGRKVNEAKSLIINGSLMNTFKFSARKSGNYKLLSPYNYAPRMLTDFRVIPKKQDFINIIKSKVLSR